MKKLGISLAKNPDIEIPNLFHFLFVLLLLFLMYPFFCVCVCVATSIKSRRAGEPMKMFNNNNHLTTNSTLVFSLSHIFSHLRSFFLFFYLFIISIWFVTVTKVAPRQRHRTTKTELHSDTLMSRNWSISLGFNIFMWFSVASKSFVSFCTASVSKCLSFIWLLFVASSVPFFRWLSSLDDNSSSMTSRMPFAPSIQCVYLNDIRKYITLDFSLWLGTSKRKKMLSRTREFCTFVAFVFTDN